MSDNAPGPDDNGAVLNIAQVKNVMSSAAEAKTGAVFINLQQTIPTKIALIEMGPRKPPYPNTEWQHNSIEVRIKTIAAKSHKISRY